MLIYTMIHSIRRREKMPPIFKALVSISVWVLFIVGWCATLSTAVMILRALPEPMSMVAVVNGASGGAFFILACVGAWIRKKLE
jgi:hypothetical protein